MIENHQIYLDYQATTPIDPAVLQHMIERWTSYGANPSSKHYAGRKAYEDLEQDRLKIARLLNVKPSELIFTSGATESINILLKGLAFGLKQKGNHIITSSIEHKAVLETCSYLENHGFDVSYIKVGTDGVVDLFKLEKEIRAETTIIAIHHANNEIGTIQPIDEIAKIASENGIHFFSDTVQSIGKIEVNTSILDSFCVSAHKMYGPMGCGLLCVKDRWVNSIVRQTHGGSQERSLRPGTHNIPGIAGLAFSLALSMETMNYEQSVITKFRDNIVSSFKNSLDGIVYHGTLSNRLPGNINFSIPGISSELLIKSLSDEIAFSAGSACTSDSNQPSHVIKALGVSNDLANGAVRISLGRFTNKNQIETFVKRFIEKVNEIKEIINF